jgi:hypothetical protein
VVVFEGRATVRRLCRKLVGTGTVGLVSKTRATSDDSPVRPGSGKNPCCPLALPTARVTPRRAASPDDEA